MAIVPLSLLQNVQETLVLFHILLRFVNMLFICLEVLVPLVEQPRRWVQIFLRQTPIWTNVLLVRIHEVGTLAKKRLERFSCSGN